LALAKLSGNDCNALFKDQLKRGTVLCIMKVSTVNIHFAAHTGLNDMSDC
jgi:hypothetical protein